MPCSWGFLGLIARAAARPSAAVGKVCALCRVCVLWGKYVQPSECSPHTWCVASFFAYTKMEECLHCVGHICPPLGEFRHLALLLGSFEAADGEDPKKVVPARAVN